MASLLGIMIIWIYSTSVEETKMIFFLCGTTAFRKLSQEYGRRLWTAESQGFPVCPRLGHYLNFNVTL